MLRPHPDGLHVPELNGYEVTAEIRRREREWTTT
jgi:CheY-like chemotaxis protein